MFDGMDRRQRAGAFGIGLIALFVVGIVGAQYLGGPQDFPITQQGTSSGPGSQKSDGVRVEVVGAVASPGSYLLPPNSQVNDAINAAGGSTASADLGQLSLTTRLMDGTTLTVPLRGGRVLGSPYAKDSSPDGGTGTVSINTASLEELDTLPRIGPVMAQRIIEYRIRIGGFKSLEEIKGVKGIGDKTYVKLLPFIRL